MFKMKWFKYSAFFQMMGISASSLIPLFWKDQLGYSASDIGFLNAIAIIIALAGPLYFGWIGTKKSLEKVIRLCFWITAIISPIILFFDNYWVQATLFAGICFFRVGLTTLVPVGVLNLLGASAAQEYGKYRRIGSLGFLIGVIGAGYLIKFTQPNIIFYILMISALLASFPYWNRLKVPKNPLNQSTYKSVLKIKGMTHFYIATTFISTWSAAAFIFMPLRLSELGASPSFIGWVVSECGIVALFTLSYLGRITDKVSEIKLYYIVPIFAFIRILFYGIPIEDYTWFILIQLIHIPTWVLGELIQVKTLRNILTPEDFSKGMGLLQVSQSLGLALGSGMLGYYSGIFSVKEAFWYASPIPLLALIFIYSLNKSHKPSKAIANKL
jgi:PPP family 3-phenylpropionic acid transporter